MGINYFGSQNELHGCVADVQRMLPLLDELGFPNDEVGRTFLKNNLGLSCFTSLARSKSSLPISVYGSPFPKRMSVDGLLCCSLALFGLDL